MVQNRYAFFEGKFIPIEEAKISIMTHALNYGTGCFEGIRAYWNEEEEQLYIFRMVEHYQRLHNSCRILLIDLPYSVEQLGDITVELLRREGFKEDTYIRPLAFKSQEGIGVRLKGVADSFAIFAIPFGKYIEREEGAKVCVSSWRRIYDTALPARAKCTGAYVNSALCKSEAEMNGFDEAIVLTRGGSVSEGSAENFFMVRNGVLITPSITSDILEGITRQTLIQLAREELHIPVKERTIDRTELYVCDEAFLCGTGVQIAAIASIDHRPVGDGKIGPITKKLRDLYFDIVRGKVPKYKHWCTPVYDRQARAFPEKDYASQLPEKQPSQYESIAASE
ncbi:MAG: branched-chain amino acid transaminase [Anaerolineae bacterium]